VEGFRISSQEGVRFRGVVLCFYREGGVFMFFVVLRSIGSYRWLVLALCFVCFGKFSGMAQGYHMKGGSSLSLMSGGLVYSLVVPVFCLLLRMRCYRN